MESIALKNARGMRVEVLPLGGILQSILVPDRDGVLGDVVLGFDTADEYRQAGHYVGTLVGRYANRIGGARFVLGGEEFRLTANEGRNHLHGGACGFHRVAWEPRVARDGRSVVLRHTSPAGEDGYPGRLEARVTYTLTDAGELVADFDASADRATPFNPTQHSYFNLAGHGAGAARLLEHELTLAATRFTPVDAELIPTGELRPVHGTPFDFTTPHALGGHIDDEDEQLRIGRGFDHNFALDGARTRRPALAARLRDPGSGRVLEIHTTEPGVQLYTANGFPAGVRGKGGVRYGPRCAVALETQHFPDSPNQQHFPPTILRPGETFTSRTVYAFGVER